MCCHLAFSHQSKGLLAWRDLIQESVGVGQMYGSLWQQSSASSHWSYPPSSWLRPRQARRKRPRNRTPTLLTAFLAPMLLMGMTLINSIILLTSSTTPSMTKMAGRPARFLPHHLQMTLRPILRPMAANPQKPPHLKRQIPICRA